jgi:hypothetical protein
MDVLFYRFVPSPPPATIVHMMTHPHHLPARTPTKLAMVGSCVAAIGIATVFWLLNAERPYDAEVQHSDDLEYWTLQSTTSLEPLSIVIVRRPPHGAGSIRFGPQVWIRMYQDHRSVPVLQAICSIGLTGGSEIMVNGAHAGYDDVLARIQEVIPDLPDRVAVALEIMRAAESALRNWEAPISPGAFFKITDKRVESAKTSVIEMPSYLEVFEGRSHSIDQRIE